MSQNTNLVYSTRLQWSEIHNSDIYNITLGCIVSITSRKFTVCRLSDDWEELLKLIHDLHINGMSNRDISDYLNSNNIKLNFLYRKLDQFSWQYCNKGFFNFKNYIPKIITMFT